jgi:hypothetical protein
MDVLRLIIVLLRQAKLPAASTKSFRRRKQRERTYLTRGS